MSFVELKTIRPLLKMWKTAKFLQPALTSVTSVRRYPYPAQYLQYLRNLPVTQCVKLQSGLTVATEERDCLNACVGLYIDAGSRHESEAENGTAHFFEHIAFKSTRARVRALIETQLATSGAKFKCFTTREMIAYYVECLAEDVPLVVDVIADCVFNNACAASDIESQKCTVYAEMIEHEKDPAVTMYDYLHGTAFQGTSLARTVMGPSSNLYNLNETTINKYLKRCYLPSRTVLAAAGGIKHEEMLYLANTYLNYAEPASVQKEDVYRYTGSEVRYRDDSLSAANVAIAVEGPCFCDSDKVVMDIAARYIGGWDRSQPGGCDLSSKIAQAAASGLCDAFKAFNITYKDTGLWGVHYMGPSLELENMLYNIQSEWMRLSTSVTDGEIQRAKRELKTKMLTKTESCLGACHDIGRWILYHDYRPPMHERISSIDRVFAEEVRSVCSKYIYDKCPVVAAVGPTEGLPDYTRIRAGMYLLRI